MALNKLQRAPNFTKVEKDILINIVIDKYKGIIENKKSDAVSRAQKEDAWKEIAADFNSRLEVTSRDYKSLKLCYENIKKRTKKMAANDKVQMYKTGGGGYLPPTVDESGRKLIAALKPQFLPLANPFDGDAGFHPEVISDLYTEGTSGDGEPAGNQEQIIEGICEGTSADGEAAFTGEPIIDIISEELEVQKDIKNQSTIPDDFSTPKARRPLPEVIVDESCSHCCVLPPIVLV